MEWQCKNGQLTSDICSINATTECIESELFGCSNLGKHIKDDQAKTPDKRNWVCSLNNKESALCTMSNKPECDTSKLY